jgi:hypothetical protein
LTFPNIPDITIIMEGGYMPKEIIKKMLLEIPEDLHSEFKVAAAKLKTTMTQLIKDMMVKTIEKTKSH